MWKKILIVILVLVAAVLIYAATKPDTLHVERSIRIKAPPEKIFPLVNDLRSWQSWSAYETKDPAMKRTFSAVTVGKGATYAWEGNSEVGAGQMTITESVPTATILIDLHFTEPFEGHDTVTFTFTPQTDGTTVKWAMDGPFTYLCKVMSVFLDMDNMIGKDFEAGLANLKAAAEK